MTELNLEKLRPLVEIMAAERTAECPELFEDCVQEGLIAAWQAAQSHPDRKPAYYQVAARRGVLAVLLGRPATGAEGRRGWQGAHDHAGAMTDGDGALVHEPADPGAVAALEAIGARDTAVAVAVARLPMGDAWDVLLKFWRGHTWGEVAAVTGRKKHAVEHRWRTITRPALRESLAGFADAY